MITVSKEEIRATVCRDSLYQFLKYFWDVFVPEKPKWNWHIEYICNELQKVGERVFGGLPKAYDLIINVPPGSSKSSIASIAFPAWVWTNMPSARCLCGSYAHPLALDLSRKCRDIIKSDKYKNLYPFLKLRSDQDTKAYFVNTYGGARYSVGTGGSVTGMHGHFLIVDDPIDPQQATSVVDLAAANTWLAETLSQRKVDKAVTPLILIMQRLHQDDPTGSRLSNRRAGPTKHICLPGEETEDITPPELRKFYVKGLLDPRRLPRRVLNAAHGDLGEFGYAGQMLQRPVPRGGAMFKVNKFVFVDTLPTHFVKVVRWWDKASTQKGGDFTVGVKMGVDEDGNYWVLDVVRGQWHSSQRENMILLTAQADGASVFIGLEQEPGSAGVDSAQNTIKMLTGFRVEAKRSTGDKETRADTFSTQVNAGNVRVYNAHWTKAYIDELKYFPRSKYDDQVDGSSGAFSMLAKPRIRIGRL